MKGKNEYITFILVDDHPVVRDGMEAMLENESDFKVVASVADGPSAIETCRRMGAPDVVVMDIRMPGMNGFETLEKLKRTFADISVLLLAGMPLKVEVEDARRLGARAVISRRASTGRSSWPRSAAPLPMTRRSSKRAASTRRWGRSVRASRRSSNFFRLARRTRRWRSSSASARRRCAAT